MLLSLIRKHAQSWLIKAIIAIIAVVFVLYFGTMRDSDRNAKTAIVNGELITTQEYRKTYYDLLDMFQQQYKDMWSDEMAKALDVKKLALNNMINKILINQEAARLGLDVTEEEIQNAVLKYAAFQVGGQFNLGQYKELLSYKRITPEQFEESLRDQLLNGKLRHFIAAFSEVTDQEVYEDYTFNNEKIRISFVQFKPDNFKASVQLNELGMKDFFEKYKENYRVPRKIKIGYLEIDPKTLEGDIKISEEDILSYYEFNADTFTEPKKVKARHILFKLPENALEEKEKEVKEKAESVLKEAREGKDFAALAKKYSEDTNAKDGGSLGYFPAGRMVKPFEDVAFGMKPGDLSDLVRTPFGYHIIKVEDVKEAKPKALDSLRDRILKTLTRNTSTDLAYEKGQMLIDQMPYDISLAEYVKGQNLEVQHSEYVAQDEGIPVIGGDKKLKQTIFALERNEISELIELRGKYYIFQVEDIKESALPEMEAVTDKVKDDYKVYLAAKDAKAAADGFLGQLKEGASWEDLVKEKQLKIESSDLLTRQGSIPKIGFEPGLQEAVFKLSEISRYPDKVFENKKGSFVVRWEAKEGIDEKKYQEEKDKQRVSLMQRKSMRFFERWLNNLNESADIEIINAP